MSRARSLRAWSTGGSSPFRLRFFLQSTTSASGSTRKMSERVTLWSPVSAVNAMNQSPEIRSFVSHTVGVSFGGIAGAIVAPAASPQVSALVVGQVTGQHGRRDMRGATALPEVVVSEGSILLGQFGEVGTCLVPSVSFRHPDPLRLPGKNRPLLVDAMGVEDR